MHLLIVFDSDSLWGMQSCTISYLYAMHTHRLIYVGMMLQYTNIFTQYTDCHSLEITLLRGTSLSFAGAFPNP